MNRWKFGRVGFVCKTHGKGHAAFFAIPDPSLRSTKRSAPRDHCSACGLPLSARLLPLVVEAPTFFDARAVARDEFHATDLQHVAFPRTSGNGWTPADVVVRWEGTDAGSRQDRRKIVERR